MRKIIVMGSIGATVIILLTLFPNIVLANSVLKLNELSSEKLTISEHKKTIINDKLNNMFSKIGIIKILKKGLEKNNWIPGTIISIIFSILLIIFFTFFPQPPPP